MFVTPTDAIVYGLSASQKMLHRFVDDLKPADFEFQPCTGANCVSWILGHLTMTDRRSLTWLGVTDLPPIPDGFADLFKTTRVPAAGQGGYGDPKELVRLFDDHRNQLIAALTTADPAKFAEPPSFASPFFSDRGEGYLFMGLHTAMHVGQLSSTRRVLGYPPLA